MTMKDFLTVKYKNLPPSVKIRILKRYLTDNGAQIRYEMLPKLLQDKNEYDFDFDNFEDLPIFVFNYNLYYVANKKTVAEEDIKVFSNKLFFKVLLTKIVYFIEWLFMRFK